jgi:hypothetical protein
MVAMKMQAAREALYERTMPLMSVTEATFQLLMSPLKFAALSNCDPHASEAALHVERSFGGKAHVLR